MTDSSSRAVLGIDIGGSSLKAGLVDVGDGTVLGEIRSAPTPERSTPAAVGEVARELADALGATGTIGVAFPGVVRAGRTWTAANVDPSWVGADAENLFAAATGRPVHLLNDADAAGLAEVAFGAGRGLAGSTLVLTFGTGIGSALIHDGELVPGLELGHLELDGAVAERGASAYAKRREELSWPQWAARVERYLRHLGRVISPDQVVVGGAISADAEFWLPLLDVPFPVVPARLGNDAGAVGAALAAARWAQAERSTGLTAAAAADDDLVLTR